MKKGFDIGDHVYVKNGFFLQRGIIDKIENINQFSKEPIYRITPYVGDGRLEDDGRSFWCRKNQLTFINSSISVVDKEEKNGTKYK